jgi:benzil reductase ((S)-benzoin forming)
MSNNKGCFIITGTSRGIGEAIAKMLLQNNQHVYGISRSHSTLTDYENYQHVTFDLGETDKIGRMLSEIMNQIFTNTDFHLICLVNSAAILEPLKAIEQADAAEIKGSINVNLIAPIVMASQFIERTKDFTIRRKIVNISSGSGTYPAADMSIYSTTKAGLNMFTRCIGVEQAGNENPVEIIAVDPGMVETKKSVF